jgi:hypothetical protein
VVPKSPAASYLLASLLALIVAGQRSPQAAEQPAVLQGLPKLFSKLEQPSQPIKSRAGNGPRRATTPHARQASSPQLSSPSVNTVFFTAPAYASGGVDANAAVIIDVNGDGKPDLLVANGYADSTESAGAVTVLLGNGDGTFQSPVSYATGGLNAVSLAVADVNNDGKPDLVVANQCVDLTCANGSVGVLLGNGDGTFQMAIIYSPTGVNASAVAVADLNHDGMVDVLVASQCTDNTCNDGEVSVLLNNGDGTFQSAVNYDSAGHNANSIAIADVNGDAIPDLVVVNQCVSNGNCTSGSVTVLLGNGDGTFQSAVTYGSGGQASHSVVIGDINADGKPDLVVANQCANSSICANGVVSVLIGNGDGTFQQAVGYGTGGQFAYSLTLGDMNGDGKMDVMAINQCAASSICANSVAVLLGNGDGTFQSPVAFAVGGAQASSIAAADVNGDGKLDLVVSNQCANSATCANGAVVVLLGNGDGTLQAPLTYGMAGSQAVSATVADINGDGNWDLIVANQCADINCASGSVSVLAGNGDGTFQPALSYGSGGTLANAISAGDLSGDGISDIAVANQCISSTNCSNGNVAILLGNRDGTFQPAATYSSGGVNAVSVALADVNADGKLDAVLANQCIDTNCATGAVSVLLGNGDGTFQTALSYGSSGPQASFVAVGDLNGDGNLDIVVSNQCPGSSICSNATISVLLGNGDGSFKPAVSYSPGGTGSAYSLAITDVNGDGKLDLVVANECSDDTCTSAGISVLLGNGDGTFQTALSSVTLSLYLAQIQSLAVADFDGDGKLDVASGDGNFLLLGNGDGTFQMPFTLGAVGPAIATGDYNHDGKPDLAVAGANSVTILRNIAANFRFSTTTSLSSSLNPAVVGQAATFTATVTPTVVAGAESGEVTFYDGATSLGTVPITNGQASFTTSSLSVGTHSIFASYAGDSSYLPSKSSALLETINSFATTTNLTSSPNPSTFGQSVVLNAAVAPSGGSPPTGTVTFTDGANVLGVAPLSNGQAAFNISSLGAGNHFLAATYTGDSNYQAGTSATLMQSVNVASAALNVTPSANPSCHNQGITFTASLTPQLGGNATGTITFVDGSNSLGKATVANNSSAITVSTLAIGTHSITTSYSGDSNFISTTSSALSQIVGKCSTTAALTSSANPSVVGQVLTFSATVSSPFGSVPNGETVTFQDGGVAIATAALNGGVASVNISNLIAGTHNITLTYNGDAQFAASVASISQVVNKNASSAVVASRLNPSSYGQLLTFTATVATANTPTGSVTFQSDGNTLGTVALAGNSASLSTSFLGAGSHSITAVYSGDATYMTAASQPLTQIVNKASPSAYLQTSQNPAASGQSVTFTVNVTSSVGVPTGAVKFMKGSTVLASSTLASGKATFTTAKLPLGSYTITANYAGAANYSANSASVTEVVESSIQQCCCSPANASSKTKDFALREDVKLK